MNPIEQELQLIRYWLRPIANARGKEKAPMIVRAYRAGGSGRKALLYLLDPRIVFHIGKKSFDKPLPREKAGELMSDFFTLCEFCQRKAALTDQDIATVQWSINQTEDEGLRRFAQDFLCKEIKLGVTAQGVNQALGFEFIPEFRCMLANKYFDHPDRVEGRHFYLTEKLDGIRCVAIVTEGGVLLFSRQGQPIEGLRAVEADLAFLRERIGKDFVMDGELLVTGREGIPSKEQYKRTTMIVRRDGIKIGVTYNVFDVLDKEAYDTRLCDTPYYMRRQRLETYCAILPTDISVRVVPILYHGEDTSQIFTQLNIQRGLQHEGVMINLADSTYKFARTNALLKVKVMQDCDLRIIDLEEGRGKLAGTLGSLIVDYKGTRLGVGTGFTDTDRRMFWEGGDKFIGRVVTVQYFEETHNADGQFSLRFPVFKELREEGKEVSYT